MIHPPLFDSLPIRRRPRPIHGLAAVIAAIGALAAISGCVVDAGGDSTGSGGGDAGGDTCHGARSTIVYNARILPSEEAVSAHCLPLDLYWDVRRMVPCVVIEGRSVGAADAASCNACDAKGRQPVNDYQLPLVQQMKEENPSAQLDCFCAVEQIEPLHGSDWDTMPCQNDLSEAPVDSQGEALDGFCYVDPARGLGDAALVGACPEDQKRILRFVGAGVPDPSGAVYLSCTSDSFSPPPADCASN